MKLDKLTDLELVSISHNKQSIVAPQLVNSLMLDKLTSYLNN